MSEPLKIMLLIKDGTYLHTRVVHTVYFIFADSTGRGGGWDRGLGDLFVLTQAATCGENGHTQSSSPGRVQALHTPQGLLGSLCLLSNTQSWALSL